MIDVLKKLRNILFSENDEAKYKWVSVKQTGIKISPRCSATGVLIQPNIAYIFGGVYDEKDDEEDLYGRFYNDLLSLDLEKFQWHTGKFIELFLIFC